MSNDVLAASIAVQEKAVCHGFEWQEPGQILDKIEEECHELRHELVRENTDKIVEEYGDLLLTVINLARHLAICPTTALNQATTKFSKRFEFMLSHCQQQGIDFEALNLEQKEALWCTLKHNRGTD